MARLIRSITYRIYILPDCIYAFARFSGVCIVEHAKNKASYEALCRRLLPYADVGFSLPIKPKKLTIDFAAVISIEAADSKIPNIFNLAIGVPTSLPYMIHI